MYNPKIFDSRPVSFFTSSNISVSFIIHTKNQFSNSSLIIQNILNCKNPFEIVLINDNSSSDQYFKEISSNFKNLKLLNSNQNHSDAINKSLEFCENNWIYYINADFVPSNSMWLNGMISSMMNLKKNNIKFISPLIKSLNFFNIYGKEKKDVILEDHFLPFNVGFFHKDLFKAIGFLESTNNLLELSKSFYFKMNKKKLKQAICVSSIFI